MGCTAWLIIAGGLGTRYGEPKYAAIFEGATFLDRTLALVSAVRRPDDRLWVVLREEQPWSPPLGVEILRDDPRATGPVAGLLAGVAAASDSGTDVLVTLPVDMPYVTPKLLRALADTSMLTSGVVVARSIKSGDTHWPLAAYPSSLFGRIIEGVGAGHRSLREIAGSLGFKLVEAEDDTVRNINHKPA